MANSVHSESAAKRLGGWTKLNGRISRKTLVRLDLDNGSTVIGPEEVILKQGTVDTIGDIVDIFCKITGVCGGGGGGGDGGKVCYKTVIGAPMAQ